MNQIEPVDSDWVDFIQTLTPDERLALKARLSSQIEGFFDDTNNLASSDGESLQKFYRLGQTLRSLTPGHQTIPNNGIAYYGRPDWVTSDLMSQLKVEALRRRDEPLDRIDHFLGCGGKFADKLSISPEVVRFVARHVGQVKPTGIASYLYYDRPGLGIRPHVDTEVFSVNLMLMLRHDGEPGRMLSSTVVFPPFQAPEHYWLGVGEVMLTFGSSIIHTRTVVQPGEVIHLLTIGFTRLEPQ